MVKIKKICLFGIYKSEEKIISRLLDSLITVIDFVCITDTGDSKEMNEVVKKWGESNSIPTTVCEGEEFKFKNFGFNRTQSYQNAAKHYPYADYYLTLDADMKIKVENEWKLEKNKLNKDLYELLQKNSSIKYWNSRILSSKYKWECVGCTHEYWNPVVRSGENISRSQLHSIWIDDIGDGSNKSNKFIRDIKLLTEGINDESVPEDLKTRYKFYLSQSYQNSGDYNNAIETYEKRIKSGGWYEEIFYSYFCIGQCYKELSNEPKAIEYYLKAWNHTPSRAEPLYSIAKYYREKGENNTAMLFINAGMGIKYPVNDKLFIDYNVYEYLFLYEMSICAYYTNEKQKGKVATLLLLSNNIDVPEHIKSMVKTNAKFYGL
jgi:tetratricopeptide (TPR) repeat protein